MQDIHLHAAGLFSEVDNTQQFSKLCGQYVALADIAAKANARLAELEKIAPGLADRKSAAAEIAKSYGVLSAILAAGQEVVKAKKKPWFARCGHYRDYSKLVDVLDYITTLGKAQRGKLDLAGYSAKQDLPDWLYGKELLYVSIDQKELMPVLGVGTASSAYRCIAKLEQAGCLIKLSNPHSKKDIYIAGYLVPAIAGIAGEKVVLLALTSNPAWRRRVTKGLLENGLLKPNKHAKPGLEMSHECDMDC